MVIFTSDNGGVKSPSRNIPQTVALKAGLEVNGALRGSKHNIWEGGFKVPFIVRWPGQIPEGTVCEEMISLADIVATTAAIVGYQLPPPGAGAEDSYNVLPALLGQKHDPIRSDMILHSSDGVFAIRKGPWKWIEGVPAEGIKPAAFKAHAREFRPQLYNLEADLAETRDVSAANPEVVAELKTLLADYKEKAHSR